MAVYHHRLDISFGSSSNTVGIGIDSNSHPQSRPSITSPTEIETGPTANPNSSASVMTSHISRFATMSRHDDRRTFNTSSPPSQYNGNTTRTQSTSGNHEIAGATFSSRRTVHQFSGEDEDNDVDMEGGTTSLSTDDQPRLFEDGNSRYYSQRHVNRNGRGLNNLRNNDAADARLMNRPTSERHENVTMNETDRTSRHVNETDRTSRHVNETDRTSRYVNETDRTSRYVNETDRTSRHVNETDRTSRHVNETDRTSRHANENGRGFNYARNDIVDIRLLNGPITTRHTNRTFDEIDRDQFRETPGTRHFTPRIEESRRRHFQEEAAENREIARGLSIAVHDERINVNDNSNDHDDNRWSTRRIENEYENENVNEGATELGVINGYSIRTSLEDISDEQRRFARLPSMYGHRRRRNQSSPNVRNSRMNNMQEERNRRMRRSREINDESSTDLHGLSTSNMSNRSRENAYDGASFRGWDGFGNRPVWNINDRDVNDHSHDENNRRIVHDIENNGLRRVNRMDNTLASTANEQHMSAADNEDTRSSISRNELEHIMRRANSNNMNNMNGSSNDDMRTGSTSFTEVNRRLVRAREAVQLTRDMPLLQTSSINMQQQVTGDNSYNFGRWSTRLNNNGMEVSNGEQQQNTANVDGPHGDTRQYDDGNVVRRFRTLHGSEVIMQFRGRAYHSDIENSLDEENNWTTTNTITSTTENEREQGNNSGVGAASVYQISRLPSFYRTESNIGSNSCSSCHACVICTEEFGDGKNNEKLLTVLPCGHEFHRTCVVDWLVIRKSCPMCRRELK